MARRNQMNPTIARERAAQVSPPLPQARTRFTVTIIIPTLNEAANLPHVLPRIPRLAEIVELIIVDGQSTDATLQIARQLLPQVRIITQDRKGKGAALRYAWEQSVGDILLTLDADGSMRPEEIPGLVEPLFLGYHLVKGSRFLPQGGTLDMPRHRRIGNRALTVLANRLFGASYTDLAYGLHAFHRKVLEKVTIRSDRFGIDAELYVKAKKAGFAVLEVPSFEQRRISGESNLHSFRDGFQILRTIIRGRFGE